MFAKLWIYPSCAGQTPSSGLNQTIWRRSCYNWLIRKDFTRAHLTHQLCVKPTIELKPPRRSVLQGAESRAHTSVTTGILLGELWERGQSSREQGQCNQTGDKIMISWYFWANIWPQPRSCFPSNQNKWVRTVSALLPHLCKGQMVSDGLIHISPACPQKWPGSMAQVTRKICDRAKK